MDIFSILRKRKIFVILFGEPIQHHGIRILLLQITLYVLKQSFSSVLSTVTDATKK